MADLNDNLQDTPKDFGSSLEENGIPKSAASLFVDDLDNPNDDGGNNDVPPITSDNDNNINKDTTLSNENNDGGNNDGNDDSNNDEDKVDIFNILNTEYESEFTPNEDDDIVTQLKNYTKHLVDKTKSSQKEQVINELKENPLIKHVLDGYSEEVVNHEKNYQIVNSIDLEEVDVETKSDLYKQSLLLKGNDEDEADEMVATAIANNTIDTKAEKAKSTLENYYKGKVDEVKASEDAIKASELENYNKIVEQVTNTVKTGFNGISLKDKELNEFIEYTTKTDAKTGLAKADLEFYKLPVEDKLTIDYMISKGLIKKIAASLPNAVKPISTNNVKSLADLNNQRKSVANNGKSSGSSKDKPASLAELKQLLGH